jgi:hypothetical protein
MQTYRGVTIEIIKVIPKPHHYYYQVTLDGISNLIEPYHNRSTLIKRAKRLIDLYRHDCPDIQYWTVFGPRQKKEVAE